MISHAVSSNLTTSRLRPVARVKVSLLVVTLAGVLASHSALCSAEQTSSRAIEPGYTRNNTGRYLEPGEAPGSTEEQDTAQSPLLVGTTAAGPFLISAAQYGLVSLNPATGAINFCAGYTLLNTGVPFGKCKKIGTISTTGLLGNARIDTTSNTHAFVTNTATGLVVECYLGFNSYSGEPVGSCISQQLQP